MLKKIMVVAAFVMLFSGVASGQLYFSDFEADNGGWSGTGDWEWGMPVGADGTALGGFGGPEPTGGFSGDNVWGTVLGGLHSPSLTSNLTQNFDFSGALGTTLSFYEWSESGGNSFDMASVNVNGNEEYLSDGASGSAWRQVTLDLSAYDGLGSVDIDFQFETTSVVERVGWYIDDVSIDVIPEPAAMSLLGLGGLGLLGLRRRR